ncbi:MAG: hypothetical protein A3H96_14605 [Acidobacteria bacterium RIFCSPLOWO2_02_FULL_67_36]|nr:MAG: hypothetical protein A3H96_14605 [Acidobacteria bacterium RIFCSPLOWO2_02_FULL_67_36]OFW18458.1 MAG: hypothetical protein A3G21_08115 [Acidobacteria bacterium RIFCSPLOWO2_12_FULL_66_21]
MADSPRIEELKRRVQSDPASIAFAALAEEYRRAGRFEDAIQTCVTGLQRHPAYLSAHVTLGRALIEVGRYDEAREELEHVLRAAPENLAAIRGLADIHHRSGESVEQYAAEDFHERTVTPAAEGAPKASLSTDRATLAPEPVAVEPAAAPGHGTPEAPLNDPVLADLEDFLAAVIHARG